MADEQTTPGWLWACARALERRRYPGITVRVEWLSGIPAMEGYVGWLIHFIGDEARLLRSGLLTAEEIANERLPYGDRNRKNLRDAFGHSRHINFRTDGRLSLFVHVPDFIPEGHHCERRV